MLPPFRHAAHPTRACLLGARAAHVLCLVREAQGVLQLLCARAGGQRGGAEVSSVALHCGG